MVFFALRQIKDAALLTLNIEKFLINNGFSLKDASAYNVQFCGYKPVFIDTLSFEAYTEGPWVAFGQFCKHFLYPLMLMSKLDLRLNKLLTLWIDGISVEIVDKMLPFSKYFSINYWLYVNLLNNAQQRNQFSHKKISTTLKKGQLLRLLDGLSQYIINLKPNGAKTEWGDYYTFTNYTDEAFQAKANIIEGLINKLSPKMVWDLGANNGYFSRIASQKNISTVAFDIDPIAVEKNYRCIKDQKDTHLLPLLLDLTNPSANIGWGNSERLTIDNRCQADLCLALALVHHLAIGNNVPFSKIAEYFSKLSKHLVIEFIPKSDSKVQELLLNRKDVFADYDEAHFLDSFKEYFSIEETHQIPESLRKIYFMKRLS